MKKGQMEVMGMVLVVALISIGLIFVIQFVILQDHDTGRKGYIESQRAANLLNSMLQTTALDCGDQQIKALLRDCALTNEITCDNGKKSCAYLNDTINVILNNTLKHWGKSYYFNASDTGLVFGQECTGSYDSKFYPVQAEHKTIIVRLMICGLEE